MYRKRNNTEETISDWEYDLLPYESSKGWAFFFPETTTSDSTTPKKIPFEQTSEDYDHLDLAIKNKKS